MLVQKRQLHKSVNIDKPHKGDEKMPRNKVDDSVIIRVYNSEGQKAAIKEIRSTYGVKDAYYVLRRLKSKPEYGFNPQCNTFENVVHEPFIELDELCKTIPDKTKKKEMLALKQNESRFDSYVEKLVKEKFMEYSRFIETDMMERIWRVNKTALESAGYHLELY